MKYATFNEALELSGRYDSAVHNSIPPGAIKISDALYFQTIRENDGVWTLVDGSIIKQTAPVATPDWPALIAQERYRREASGILFDTWLIDTSRDGQALIAGAAVSAILDPNYHCNWKTGVGFIELQAHQLIAIANAVRTHVQACFDRELMLLRAIEAGEFHDAMLTEGWPGTTAG